MKMSKKNHDEPSSEGISQKFIEHSSVSDEGISQKIIDELSSDQKKNR